MSALSPASTSEASRRLMLVRAFRCLRHPSDPGAVPLGPREAARKLGVGRASIWRWENAVNGHDLDDPVQLRDVLAKLAAPLRKATTDRRGHQSKWAPLLLVEDVRTKLREIHASTLAASCDLATRDRRTGDYTTTLKAFTVERECPADLKPLLLDGRFPHCFKRFLAQVTPEIEAVIRGPKHFQLGGFSGRRDKTIGLPDGRRAQLPAGWVIELDDMSVNQPFWVEGADGRPILSRQGLYARCLIGGWRGVELVARPRESYTSADILRFIRRLCRLYGKPRTLRIERSVWAARNIAGFTLDAEVWREEEFQCPEMSGEERQRLQDGLAAIGIEVEYCTSPRGKSDLEGAFHPLQKYLAVFTRDFPNIGRHAGEFEHAVKQLRRVRAGSHHPRDLGFPHQGELLPRIQQAFDFINALPRANAGGPGKTTFDDLWARDTARWPLTPLTHADMAAFLPTWREREITGGAVYPKVNGVEFAFRAIEFAELGDGYKTFVRFDETEPSLGAAIYCREGDSAANHQQHKPGEFICYARYDVPAPTAYAARVPDDLPALTVEERYGPGAVADGGALLKQQRTAARQFVRAAFSGRVPGRGDARATVAIEVRGGPAVSKLELRGGVAAPEPRPATRAAAAEQQRARNTFALLAQKARELAEAGN